MTLQRGENPYSSSGMSLWSSIEVENRRESRKYLQALHGSLNLGFFFFFLNSPASAEDTTLLEEFYTLQSDNQPNG